VKEANLGARADKNLPVQAKQFRRTERPLQEVSRHPLALVAAILGGMLILLLIFL
jgi:hypothetical protein